MNAAALLSIGTRVRFLVDIQLDNFQLTIEADSLGTIRNVLSAAYVVEPDGHSQLSVLTSHTAVEQIDA